MTVAALIISRLNVLFNKFGVATTVTPYTMSSGDGGWTGATETGGTATTPTAIPFNEVKNLFRRSFGDLEKGEFQLALKSTAVFDISGATRYKITYNSDTYDITRIQRYAPSGTLVAWIVTLIKRVD